MQKAQILYEMLCDMSGIKQADFHAAGQVAFMGGGGLLWIWLPDGTPTPDIHKFFRPFLETGCTSVLGIVGEDFVAQTCAAMYAKKYGFKLCVKEMVAYCNQCPIESEALATAFGYACAACAEDWRIVSEWMSAFYAEVFDTTLVLESDESTSLFSPMDVRMYVWHHEKPVAMAMYVAGNATARLNFVYVPPESRGFGYGRAITRHVLQEIRKLGKLPTLYTYTKNKTANKLYKSLGFSEVGRLMEVRFMRCSDTPTKANYS